ncbi:DUF1793-domain-containing protein [Wolfiporia cocos MD-104 SS10]|uniref:DUF1793-domain-containing protein n=1 Tax=Wolfiporia cocos (strain MD-104) TaxID=742152 RepID=A0A2H3JMK7_WOLCO|nr:DUF1793-domain-containing protein [Wolfiporia cocos MD-104 SS10]
MDLSITFLSPIEPSDWVRQSIPFSYISLEASSNDGEPHQVEVYSDISADWLSGNLSALVEWSTTTSQQSLYHEASLQSPAPFVEINGQAEDGSVFYAMSEVSGIMYQTGRDQTVRGIFESNGSLLDTQDTSFRAINDGFPVFAIAVNLGLITSTANPVVWALGYVRNPVIKYTTPTGESQLRYPYWATQYSSIPDVIEEVLSDFTAALSRATELDNRVMAATSSISTDYTNIVSLGARQAFAGIDITVSNGTDGAWNVSDVKIFMKNVGTDRRANPVEVMFAAYPIFLYFNSSFCNPLLSPLLEYEASSFYTLPYAASDLGNNYPIASGDNSTQQAGGDTQGVEQSANMLIMALAAARASGDGSLLAQYYTLLSNWTNYLVQNSGAPSGQVSADGQSTANMTNLAIKGIIGIQAMSEISKAVQEDTDSQKFSRTASVYMNSWKSLALSSNQQNILFAYGDSGSWGLMYNLYADLLLQTHLVDETIYQDQTAFYDTLINGGSAGTFGLPIDSLDPTVVNSAWLMFTATTTTNDTVRNQLISYVWDHASDNLTAGAFPTVYNVNSGAITQSYANPAQGALFAPLALTIANTTIKIPPAPSAVTTTTTTKASHVGEIVGGVVGGVGGLACILLLGFCFWRRSRREGWTEKDGDPEIHEVDPFTYQPVPVIPAASITSSNTSLEQQPPVAMSPKIREYLASQRRTRTAPTPVPASNASESTSASAPQSSQEPTMFPSAADAVIPSPEILGLQTEVENLRRAMEQLREERVLDAPPEYVAE